MFPGRPHSWGSGIPALEFHSWRGWQLGEEAMNICQGSNTNPNALIPAWDPHFGTVGICQAWGQDWAGLSPSPVSLLLSPHPTEAAQSHQPWH